MGVRFLTWFLFASCIQAISNSDFHRNFTSEQTVIPKPSKIGIVQIHEPVEKYRYGISKESLKLDTKVEKKNYKLSYDSRSQRGKGAYGGGSVNHRPIRSENSAPSLLPCIPFSSLSVSLALIVLFSFHLR